MAGFIKLDRDLITHPVLRARERDPYSAFLWLVQEAALAPRTIGYGRHTTQIARGQLIHSVRHLAATWGWSRMRVYRFLQKLAETGLIQSAKSITEWAESGTASGTAETIITICNYDVFSGDLENVGQPVIQPRDSDGTSNKNLKESKNQKRKSTHPSDECRRQPDLLGAEVVTLTPASDDVQQAFAAYQALARELNLAVPMSLDTNLPRSRQTRRAALRQCLRDCGGVDGWDAVLTAVRGATFITSGRWRSFSLDDLLNRRKLETLMAGRYSQVWTDGPARNAENPALQQMRDYLEEHHEESLFRTMSTVGTVKS